ncbi:hypothetical protein DFH29DRAFT_1070320 [Suillus ampliporus]|nr:hypothetical protein DFH29DRAFT_1070320 [Suillus ampliporus]
MIASSRQHARNLEGQSIRFEVISGKNIDVPSFRMPAGIYVSIKHDETRCWKSAIRVLSSDNAVAWGDTVTLSSHASPTLSMEIRASFELGRTLGNGELIGNLETSWDDLLDHGDEPFDLSFQPVRGVHSSLTLKIASVHACGNEGSELYDSIIDCEIARRTDAGHAQFAEYMASESVSHLNDAVEHFQSVLEQCPVDHPDRGAAFINLAGSRLQGYICNNLEDIDSTTSLFRDALALRSQDHLDHALSLYHLTRALIWRSSKERTVVDIHESARLCRKLLALCPEGTNLRRIGVDSAVDYVIGTCNDLPIDTSDEGVQLRRLVLELCPLGHQYRSRALDELSRSLNTRFSQHGSIDDIDESIQLGREAVSLCPEGHPDRDTYLNNLAFSLRYYRFRHQGKPEDLNEAISLYEEALRLRPAGHKFCDLSLGNLGGALIDCFKQHGDINDINRAISLDHEALVLCPPGHHRRDTMLNNLALALKTRYDKLHASDDLNEAIDLYRKSLRLRQHDNPERHINLYNLSSALCSRFTQTPKNEDVEEAIALCQESLATLPSLHPDRYFSYVWLREAYLSRFRVQHNLADLSLAVENFRVASRHPTQGLPHRIIGSYNWTVAAEQHGHDGSALEAYATFFELLDAHLSTRSSTTSRREAAAAFSYAKTLPVDAASCALRHDQSQKAVELVEQGTQQARFERRPGLLQLSSTEPPADLAATEYRRNTEQWEAAVAAIPQCSSAPWPSHHLHCQQILMQCVIVPKSGEPHHVPFPSLALADLEMLKVNFARAIRHASHMGPNGVKDGSHSTLAEDMGRDHATHRQAHPSRTKADCSGRELCLEDIYICSYTPTLSALIRARQAMKTHPTPSFVAIGQSQPGAGQGEALLTVDSELELVHELVPPNATTMLRKHEFAFLSACHTAVGDEETPDEVIHLAAGLQFSGFKSVIGTLWVVDDDVAKHVVEAFYTRLFKGLEEEGGMMDCTKAASALNHATYNVKNKVPLEQRIVFVHIGYVLLNLRDSARSIPCNLSSSPLVPQSSLNVKLEPELV